MGGLTYISACSGIEAVTVAWDPLGFVPLAFAEIEKFPAAVLKHHYPNVPNVGDFTKIKGDEHGAVDVLVAGTPCQDFSVAGLRAGMDGQRGQLTVEFAHLAGCLRTRWLVWENVPGVLSIDGGRAFGMFLGLLGKLGYGFAYRVLDAQHFGVPQRRRRVFVVGHLGDWRRAAAVLFERQSLSGYPAPRRETGQEVSPTISARTHGGGGLGTDFDCDGGLVAFGGNNTSGPIDIATAVNACGTASGRMDFESETFIAHALRADGFDASEDGTGRGTPLVACPLTQNQYGDNESRESLLVPVIAPCLTQNYGKQPDNSDTNSGLMLLPVAIQERAICENPNAGPDGAGVRQDGLAYTLEARSVPQAVAFDCKSSGRNGFGIGDVSPTLRAMGHVNTPQNAGGQVAVAAAGMAVRRLTPRECERLQGFPDDYTKISAKTADGPRYKALGNSMAVPVMRWIGERIAMVDLL